MAKNNGILPNIDYPDNELFGSFFASDEKISINF
jgi:hypothetical protein